MINYYFLISHHCNHFIKKLILLSSKWFPSLNFIHILKTEWSVLSIDRNIGVIIFKPVHIIIWWTDTDSFKNGDIPESIIDIQNLGRESIFIHNINIDYEGVSMCHGTVGFIKINTLSMRTPIFTVA